MIHPHQHRALVAFLRRPEYSGLSVDEAFARVTAVEVIRALGRTRFLTTEDHAALPEKRRRNLGDVVFVTNGEVIRFPTGLPGFPNKIKREWFDAAWREARP